MSLDNCICFVKEIYYLDVIKFILIISQAVHCPILKIINFET